MLQTQFDAHVLTTLSDRPFGSLTRRELGLIMVRAAMDSSFVRAVPVQITKASQFGLTKSKGYLTGLALRPPTQNDDNGASLLEVTHGQTEVRREDNHLVVLLNDARLRTWLERKLSAYQLQQGESLCRKLMKLTPTALCKVIDSAQGLGKPYLVLKALSKRFGKELWCIAAMEQWLSALKNVGGLSSIMPAVLSSVTGKVIA